MESGGLTPWLLYFCQFLNLKKNLQGYDASSTFSIHSSSASWLVLAKSFTGLYLLTGVEWGLHFPAANGEYQSPINLNSREALYDPSLLDVRLSPNYVVCRDCEVINDGHTVRIILRSKSGDCWGTRLHVVSFVATTSETWMSFEIIDPPLLPDVFPMIPWCSCAAVSCKWGTFTQRPRVRTS